MIASVSHMLTGVILLLGAYAVLKFAFFFILPYARRRALLDKSYDGKAFATGTADWVLLGLTIVLAALLFATGHDPIAILGGLFVGATLMQLFFHAFHAPVPAERDAPEPVSPLKRMSYAIQDRPARAWKEMAVYAVIVLVGIALYFAK